ncbi:MAG TPA: RNA polymerase sigma factor [Polyangiales bacterium]
MTSSSATALASLDTETVKRLHPVLLRVAQRMVGERALADDVVQETWLNALCCVKSYQGRSSLLTWLVAIMRRRICDVRRQGRRLSLELQESSWTSEPTWSEQVHARALLDSLRGALVGLTDRERAAVMLCDVEECERDEAAEQLGVTRGHLRVLLHRGHQQIRLAAQRQACTEKAQ